MTTRTRTKGHHHGLFVLGFLFYFLKLFNLAALNHVDHAYVMDMRRSLQSGNLLYYLI
jgi:hypothetical protein